MLLFAMLSVLALSDPAPDPEMVFSPAGLREFQVGATFESVQAITEWPLEPAIGEGGRCEEYRVGDDIGLYVMVEDGSVSRVTVTDSGWFTAEGVTVGDSADKVRSTYGDKVVRQTAPYTGEPDYDLYVWTGPDRGYRFEIGDRGEVEVIHAGTRSIEYIEGCL